MKGDESGKKGKELVGLFRKTAAGSTRGSFRRLNSGEMRRRKSRKRRQKEVSTG